MAATAAPKAAGAAKLPACGFSVHGSKNGALPIKVEKRPKGKKVMIISNVQGSAKSLASALSSLLGCGATTRQEASGRHWTVEVQGEDVDRMSAVLTQLDCLRGIKKDTVAHAKKKAVEVATRVCAYDKFLKRGEPERGKAKDNTEVGLEITPLPEAECTKWHGPWMYCRGRCERTDLSDVWEESLAEDTESLLCRPCQLPAPISAVELNLALQNMGMLAEIGSAVRGAFAGIGRGMSVAEFRKAALAPGARFIDDEPAPRGKARARSRAASRARSRAPAAAGAEGDDCSQSCAPSRSVPPPAARQWRPPKISNVACPLCGCAFALQRTLRLHMKTTHPHALPVQKPKAPAVPQGCPAGRALSRGPPKGLLAGPGQAGPSPEAALPAKAPAPPRPSSTDWPLPEDARSTSQASAGPSAFQGALALADWAPAPSLALPAQPQRQQPGALPGAGGAGAVLASCEVAAPAAGRSAGVRTAGGGSAAATGGRDEQPERYQVVRSHRPTDKTQIAVTPGMEVVVRWRQSAEDGAYWAWVQLSAGSCQPKGYVPLMCLKPLECPANSAPSAAGGGTAGVQKRGSFRDSGREDPGAEFQEGAIPEDWLGSFLMLELSAEAAREFWELYERLKSRGLPLEDAWLTAMNHATGGPMAPEFGASRLPAELDAEEDEETELQLPCTSRPNTVQHSRHARGQNEHAALQQDHSGSPCLEANCWARVVKRWKSQDQDQLSVAEGSGFLMDWVQPQGEGGFWVYGSVEGSANAWGYVPRHILRPCSPRRSLRSPTSAAGNPVPAAGHPTNGAGHPTPAASNPVPAAGHSTNGAGHPTPAVGNPVPAAGHSTNGAGHPTPAAGNPAPAAGQPAYTSGHPAPAACNPPATAGYPSSAANNPAPAAGTPIPAGGSSTPSLCHQGAPGGRWRKQQGRNAAPDATATACPQPEPEPTPTPKSETIVRAEPCRGVDDGSSLQCRVQGFRREEPQGRSDSCTAIQSICLADEDHHWAEKTLGRLMKRYCAGTIDKEVACSSLVACQSCAQLQQEAIMLLADNVIVRNFAADLWNRLTKHGSVGGRIWRQQHLGVHE